MKALGAFVRAALVFTFCAMAVRLCPVQAAEAPPTPAAIPPGLSLARIFNHHMVLQRGRPIKVWGWADEGQQITVTFAGQTKSATAGADRSWTVQLDPLEASFEGRDLTVTSSGGVSLKLKDVLVGEVWPCGGQSNMSFPLWVRSDGFVKEDANKFPFLWRDAHELGPCLGRLGAGTVPRPHRGLNAAELSSAVWRLSVRTPRSLSGAGPDLGG